MNKREELCPCGIFRQKWKNNWPSRPGEASRRVYLANRAKTEERLAEDWRLSQMERNRTIGNQSRKLLQEELTLTLGYLQVILEAMDLAKLDLTDTQSATLQQTLQRVVDDNDLWADPVPITPSVKTPPVNQVVLPLEDASLMQRITKWLGL